MRLRPLIRAMTIGLVAWSTLAACNGGVCKPKEEQTCACPGGGKGTQRCDNDGSRLGSCDCTESTSTAEAVELERRIRALESAQRTTIDRIERLSKSAQRVDEQKNPGKRSLPSCRCKPADPLCDCL